MMAFPHRDLDSLWPLDKQIFFLAKLGQSGLPFGQAKDYFFLP